MPVQVSQQSFDNNAELDIQLKIKESRSMLSQMISCLVDSQWLYTCTTENTEAPCNNCISSLKVCH